MFCSKCGSQVAQDARFCGSCGTVISGASNNPDPSAVNQSPQSNFSRTPRESAPPLPPLSANSGAAASVPPPVPPSSVGATIGAIPPLPDHNQAPDLHAGFWLRVAAALIDTLIILPVALVLGFLLGIVEMLSFGKAPEATGWVLGVVLGWLYFAFCESSAWQATPGKRMLGLRVTDIS